MHMCNLYVQPHDLGPHLLTVHHLSEQVSSEQIQCKPQEEQSREVTRFLAPGMGTGDAQEPLEFASGPDAHLRSSDPFPGPCARL